jgi:hypothetical protein
MWHYLYFIVHLRTKSQTEYTGPESFVSTLIQQNDLKWFPRHQAMSLQLLPANDEQADTKQLAQVNNIDYDPDSGFPSPKKVYTNKQNHLESLIVINIPVYQLKFHIIPRNNQQRENILIFQSFFSNSV